MPPLRLAFAGKGGAGKSLLAGTVARVIAQQGRPVLALDSDVVEGLAVSLGTSSPDPPLLMEAAERGEDKRWRLKRGIGPVRAVRRYSAPAPDGVRLLQLGKVGVGGQQAIMASVQAFYRVVHRLRAADALREWSFVGDMPAGPRQTAFDWAPYADTIVLVTEPTWQSMLTARRIAGLVRARGDTGLAVVANKVRESAQVDRIAEVLGIPVTVTAPLDPEVRQAERAGLALIDHAPLAATVRAARDLVDALERRG